MIKAILMDCDGVLTDGTYLYSAEGKAFKRFSCIDSKAISKAKSLDICLGVISEDPSGHEISEARCRDMGINYYRASSPEDKLIIAGNILKEKNISLDECAYIADDVGDFFLLKKVAVVVGPANATPEIKEYIKSKNGYITELEGGKGAVREAIQWILDRNDQS